MKLSALQFLKRLLVLTTLIGIAYLSKLLFLFVAKGKTQEVNLYALIFMMFSWTNAVLTLFLAGIPKFTLKYLIFVFFGAISFIFAGMLQGLINGGGSILFHLSPLNWQHHFYFAPGAAISQTTAKIIAILLAFKLRFDDKDSSSVTKGLLIGLGFTLMEIFLISVSTVFNSIANQDVNPQMLPVGCLERLTSSLFHIYSSGIIAFALLVRRKNYIIFVIIIHTLTDFLAGIVTTGILGITIVQLGNNR